MNGVKQNPTVGECVRCCFATIFNMPKDSLPFFGADIPLDATETRCSDDDPNICWTVIKGTDIPESVPQWSDINDWLGAMGLGLDVIQPSEYAGNPGVEHDTHYFRRSPDSHQGLVIANGPAARGYHHAVVWDPSIERDDEHPLARGIWNGDIVHDPHPDNTGLTRIDSFWCFRVIDPAKAIRTTIADAGEWPRPSVEGEPWKVV